MIAANAQVLERSNELASERSNVTALNWYTVKFFQRGTSVRVSCVPTTPTDEYHTSRTQSDMIRKQD